MQTKAGGWILLLLALSRGSKLGAWSALLGYVEPEELWLAKPPDASDPQEKLWSRYARDTKRSGPPVVPDPPGRLDRQLNDFERWALRPHFPAEVLDTTLHIGGLSAETLRLLKRAGIPEHMVLAKAEWDGSVWINRTNPALWTRWWLGVLAHELSHIHQIRMGATTEEAISAVRKHGYRDSPVERQARWKQREVVRELWQRAKEFYA